ncbi:MAG: hypothetical protein ACK4HJ_15565 [Acidovorax sp.]
MSPGFLWGVAGQRVVADVCKYGRLPLPSASGVASACNIAIKIGT